MKSRSTTSRDTHDRYYTPPWCVEALMLALPEIAYQRVLEPCSGEGHIAQVLERHHCDVATADLLPPPSKAQGLLFGHARQPDLLGDLLDPVHQFALRQLGAEWVVTNPPYSLAADILRVCLGLAPHAAALLRLSWLEDAGGRRDLLDRLALIVIVGRVRYLGPAGHKGTDSVASAWLVWRAGHEGEPKVVWMGKEDVRLRTGGMS